MDWENEAFVKLYTRDTITWRMWPWQARALLPLLFRKAPRDGRLNFGDHDPSEAIGALVMLPPEVVAVGLDAMTRGKEPTVVIDDGVLILKNFVSAQEARASARIRKAQQRDRERAFVSKITDPSPSTLSEIEQNFVTKCHAESHDVTLSHTMSQSVTNRLDQIRLEINNHPPHIPPSPRAAVACAEMNESSEPSHGIWADDGEAVTSPPDSTPLKLPWIDLESTEPPLLAQGSEPEKKARQKVTQELGENETPEDIRTVLDAMKNALRELDQKYLGPRDTPDHRKIIRRAMKDCKADTQDWLKVIAAKLEEVRPHQHQWRWLNLHTIGVPKAFQDLLIRSERIKTERAEIRKKRWGMSDWSADENADGAANQGKQP